MCPDGGQDTLKEGEPRGGCEKRLALYKEHRAYQAEASDPNNPKYIKKITAGPMVSDDDKMMRGSCFVVEVKSREEAETFYKNDPFYKNGVWETVIMHRYIMAPGCVMAEM